LPTDYSCSPKVFSGQEHEASRHAYAWGFASLSSNILFYPLKVPDGSTYTWLYPKNQYFLHNLLARGEKHVVKREK
jgi:hypothetical protein